MDSPSWIGDVNITLRSFPLLRPVVVSSSTGMLPASQPNRPPLIRKMTRWTVFIAFNVRSLGIRALAVHDCLDEAGDQCCALGHEIESHVFGFGVCTGTDSAKPIKRAHTNRRGEVAVATAAHGNSS